MKRNLVFFLILYILILFNLSILYTNVKGEVIIENGPHTDWKFGESSVNPQTPKVGETVNFQVKVGIITLIDPLPQTVEVAFYIDGTLHYSTSITFTQPLEEITVQTDWTAIAGEHYAKWVIDPSLQYSDPQLENNFLGETITVEEINGEILTVDTPLIVVTGEAFTTTGTFDYSLPSLSAVEIRLNQAGDMPIEPGDPMLDSQDFSLEGEGTQPFTFSVDAPSSEMDWDLVVTLWFSGQAELLLQDEYTFTVTVAVSEPNIMISSFTLSNNEPVDGEMVTVMAEIANTGDAAAENTLIKFTLNGESIYQETVTINPSDSYTSSFIWTAEEGSHTLAVEAWESIETIEVTVSSPPPVTTEIPLWVSIVGIGLGSTALGYLFLRRTRSRAREKVTPTTPLETTLSCDEILKRFNKLKKQFAQELKGITNQWNNLQKTIKPENRLRKKLQDAEGKVAKTRKLLQKLVREKEARERTYQTTRASKIPYQEIDQTFKQLSKSHKKKMQKYNKKIKEVEEELQKRDDALRSLNEEAKKATDEREQIMAAIENSQRRIDNFEVGIREIIEKWPHCIKCDDIKDLLKVKNERLNKVSKALSEDEIEYDNTKDEVEKLKQKRNKLRDDINNRNKRLDEIREKLKRLFGPFTEKPRGFGEAESKGWMELVPGVKTYFIGNKGAEELIKHFDKVRREYRKLRDEFKKINMNAGKTEEELENIERELKGKEERIKLENEKIAKLNNEKRPLEDNVNYLEAKYAECIERERERIKKLNDCKQEIDNLNERLNETLKNFENKLRETDKVINEVDKQKKKVEDLKHKFKKAMKRFKDIFSKLEEIIKFTGAKIPDFKGLWDWGDAFGTAIGYLAEDLANVPIPTDTIKVVGEFYSLFKNILNPMVYGGINIIRAQLGIEGLGIVQSAWKNMGRITNIARKISKSMRNLAKPVRVINDNISSLEANRKDGAKLINDIKNQLADFKEVEDLDECREIKERLKEKIEQLQEAIKRLDKGLTTIKNALKEARNEISRITEGIRTISDTAKGLEMYREAMRKHFSWRK